MHLVHDQMRVTLQRLRIVDKAHQKDARGHKRDLGDARGLLALHAHVVAYSLAYAFFQLGCYTPCYVDSCKAPWLRADDLDVLLAHQSSLQNILGYLCCLPASCVARYDDHLASIHCINDLLFMRSNRQFLGRISDRLGHSVVQVGYLGLCQACGILVCVFGWAVILVFRGRTMPVLALSGRLVEA